MLCAGKGGREREGWGNWRSCSSTKAFKTYETLNDLHTCRKKNDEMQEEASKKEAAQWHKTVVDCIKKTALVYTQL